MLVVVTAVMMVVLMVVLVVATVPWTLQRPHPPDHDEPQSPAEVPPSHGPPSYAPPTMDLDRLSEVLQARVD